jgi:hypothetical protein
MHQRLDLLRYTLGSTYLVIAVRSRRRPLLCDDILQRRAIIIPLTFYPDFWFNTQACINMYISFLDELISTYGHSQLKTGHPVRSAIHKQLNGRLVLRWVTTWESLLLYVLHFLFCPLSS